MAAFTADNPILPLADQISLAERRFCHALIQGCSREANRWARVLEWLDIRRLRLPTRSAASDANPPAPGRESWESKKFPDTPAPASTALHPSANAAEPAAQARAPP